MFLFICFPPTCFYILIKKVDKFAPKNNIPSTIKEKPANAETGNYTVTVDRSVRKCGHNKQQQWFYAACCFNLVNR